MNLCGFGIKIKTFETRHGIGCRGSLLLKGKPVADYDEEDPRAYPNIETLDGWDGKELFSTLDAINTLHPIPDYEPGNLEDNIATMFRLIEQLQMIESRIEKYKNKDILLGIVFVGDSWIMASDTNRATLFEPEVISYKITATDDIVSGYDSLWRAAKRSCARKLLGPVLAMLIVNPAKDAPLDMTAEQFAGMYQRVRERKEAECKGHPAGGIQLSGFGLLKKNDGDPVFQKLSFQGKPVVSYSYRRDAELWMDTGWNADTLHNACDEINNILRIRGYIKGDLASSARVMAAMLSELEDLYSMYRLAEELRTDETYICAFCTGYSWTLSPVQEGLQEMGNQYATPVEGRSERAAFNAFVKLTQMEGWSKRFGHCTAARIIPCDQGFPMELSGKEYVKMFLDVSKLELNTRGGAKA